jgi:hypothetical protein
MHGPGIRPRPLGRIAAACVMAGVMAAGRAAAEVPMPSEWSGMQRVERPGLDAVYLRDGASLAKYRRVLLDPVDVSFDRNFEPSRTTTSRARPDVADTRRIREDLAKLAQRVVRRELEQRGGYPVADAPGEDVLRIRAQIVDLQINAPDVMQPGVRTYVVNAGEMTLVADLYDSETNALIGHVIDRQRGIDTGPWDLRLANRVTNTAEADRILSMWAGRLRNALDKAR